MISYGAKYSIMVCDYIPDIADKSTNENMRHYLSSIDFNDVIVVLVNDDRSHTTQTFLVYVKGANDLKTISLVHMVV